MHFKHIFGKTPIEHYFLIGKFSNRSIAHALVFLRTVRCSYEHWKKEVLFLVPGCMQPCLGFVVSNCVLLFDGCTYMYFVFVF